MKIILIDIKEHFAEFVQSKLNLAGVPSEIINLPYPSGCDYLISNTHGSCGIQRKDSMAELSQQMEDLRYDILPRLCTFTDNPILLVEETHMIGEKGYLFRRDGKVWTETGLHCTAYYGFLETVRNMGVDVVCTRSLEHSIWYMVSMHTYLGKYHYPKHPKMYKVDQMATGMLCCVNGVGEKKAEKVLKKYSLSELPSQHKVDGLTEKQLEKVKKVLRWKE